ncbi:hypothetical protein Dimus_028604, partial [Dionaea muscipula]
MESLRLSVRDVACHVGNSIRKANSFGIVDTYYIIFVLSALASIERLLIFSLLSKEGGGEWSSSSLVVLGICYFNHHSWA